MARRPSTQEKSLPHQNPDDFAPDLGLLMQHLHGRNSKGTGDTLDSLNANDSPRIFPFQATPSGNLKIVPNQVVFESKKVSVLVAEPRHAKVNVKAEQSNSVSSSNHASASIRHQSRTIDLPPGVTSSTVDRLQAQHRLPAQDCRPRTQPFNRSKLDPQMQQQKNAEQEKHTAAPGQIVNQRTPRLDDVPLAALGFTSEQPIDWKNITLPEKTDLYQELAKRITTYKNADCIVRIGNDEFHCHLLVLQSYSTFFDDKNVKEIDLTRNFLGEISRVGLRFSIPMYASVDSHESEMQSSVTSGAFSIIYDWMISRTSESCHLLRRDNILEIFLAAQYLGIKELEEQCWAFIDNDELFSEDTAFLLYLEARKIGNTAVMELMVPRIMKFFLMLVSTKDFLELSVEELCLLLRSNYISVNSEMEILMSAVRWLMYDWEGRKKYLLEVMKCVRFGLIAPWQLVDVKRNPENPEFMELMSYPEVQKMVDDGLAFVIIKYWYGNQTEDYYHWIDLLGLTEPTNRNWAGEDKNYVTYREFLLYLEEYQKTKVSEFKNKKPHEKPSPPSSPPKEDSSLQTTPLVRTRVSQNSKAAEMISTTANAKPSKHPAETMGNNAPNGMPPCMMMSPEILGQYLSSIGRNGTKPVTDDAGKISKPGMNPYYVKRISGGGDLTAKPAKANRRSEAEKNNTSTKKSKKVQGENILQPRSKYLQSKQTSTSNLDNLSRNLQSAKYSEDKSDSSKSEEEAATTIQAVYRGYKARRNFKIKKKIAEDKQNKKRIADLLTIPVELNLHKSLEPVQVASYSGVLKQNQREDKNNASRSQEMIEAAIVKVEDARTDNHVKTLVPSSFNETCLSWNLIETIMSPAYSNTMDENESSASISMLSTIAPSDSASSDDTYSPLRRDRSQNKKNNDHEKLYYSTSEMQTRRKMKRSELTKFSKCKPVIADAKNCLSPEPREEVSEDEVVLVFGGIDPHADYGRRGNSGRDVYGYRADQNSWEFVGEIPEPRHHHSVAYLTSRIYLAGGADPREDDIQRRSIALGTVWSYDPRGKNWYREPSMLTPRQNFGFVVSDGKLFAIGGQNKDGKALKTVEVFDPRTREWKEVQSMQIPRVGPACAMYEDHIWVAGGMTKSKKEPLTKDVECYDVLRNMWYKVKPLKSPRCFSCLYVVSNRLLVVGGAGKTSGADGSGSIDSIGSIDAWDPSLCSWQRQAEISTARHGHAVCTIGDKLMILGGVTTLYMRALKSVECYCCEEDKWIKGISPLPFAISGHSAVSLPSAYLLIDS